MAWRPHDNLIAGELDNTVPGKVTGWMLFFRKDKPPLLVNYYLNGDFPKDIRGKKIRFANPDPRDKNELFEKEGTYMDGFSETQTGRFKKIVVGPGEYHPFVTWFSRENKRVVVDLDPNYIEVIDDRVPLHIVPT